MSDEGERITRIETGLANLEKTVDRNHQESVAYWNKAIDKMSNQSADHYAKSEEQGKEIVSLQTTVRVLKWVIVTGISGLGLWIKLKP